MKTWFQKIIVVLILVVIFGCKDAYEEPSYKDDDSYETKIQDQTVVLDDNDIDKLASVGTGVLYFDSAVAEISSGSVIASGVNSKLPKGILAEVMSISADGKTVYTKQATLEDAIEECNVDSWHEFKALKSLSFDSIEGVSRGTSLDYNFHLDIDDAVLFEDGDNSIIANGEVDFNISSEISLKMKSSKIQFFKVGFDGDSNANLEISGNADFSNSEKISIAKYGAIATVYAGIPIVIYYEIEVYIDYSGEVHIEFSTDADMEVEFEAGLTYESSLWSPFYDKSYSFGYTPPDVDADMRFNAGANIELKALLYGIAGPHVIAREYLDLQANNEDSPWLELYLGMQVFAGVDTGVLGNYIADIDLTLVDISKLLYSVGEEPEPGKDYPSILVGTVNVGDAPIDIAISPDGKYAYICNLYSDSVSVINISSRSVVREIEISSLSFGVQTDITVSPDGKYIYTCSDFTSNVSVIRTSDFAVIETIDIGDSPTRIVVSPDGKYVYTCNTDDSSISIIRTSDFAVIETINTSYGLWDIELSPSGDSIYFSTYFTHKVNILDTSSYSAFSPISIDGKPGKLACTSNGDYLYVGDISEDNVYVIRTNDFAVIETIDIGDTLYDLAVSPDDRYLYVSCGDHIIVVQTNDNSVIDDLQIDADEFAFSLDGIFIYATQSDNKRIAIIGLDD